MRLGHDVEQTTWSGDEKVTPLLELGDLLTDRPTAVCYTGSQHGAVAESASFVEDLTTELTSGCDNEDKWLATNAIALGVEVVGQVWSRCSQLLGFAHELGDHWNEECSSLAGA